MANKPKWNGNLNVAVWENEDGSLYLKIGDLIKIRCTKNTNDKNNR